MKHNIIKIHALRTALSLSLAAASIFFVSCGEDSDSPKATVADKTIFVFMPYSGPQSDLYKYFINNLKHIEMSISSHGGLGNNKLVVFISSKGMAGSNVTDSLYQVVYDGGKFRKETIRTYEDYDCTTPSGISSLLNEVKTAAPANTYAMIVGCHGEGWLPKYNRQRVTTKFFGGSSARYQIDIADFAKGISSAGMKMQFILFDDCYLSCVENAYDLRNATDYMIASTSEVMAYGMPYDRIFNELTKKSPDYNLVCKEFIDFYSNYVYTDPTNGAKEKMPYGTIGITNCKYVEDMAAMMKSINSTHTFDASKIGEVQDLDADHWYPSTETVYFDFADYVSVLCGNDAATISKFMALLDKMLPYKGATSEIFSASPYPYGATLKIRTYSGITISDPSINPYAIDAKKNTAWWVATH